MGNTITQADVSAANWANETAAAAEAYAENQADEAARQRDAQRAREEQGDGVDPPPGRGEGSDPMFDGVPGASRPGQSPPPAAVQLSDKDVSDLRASGMTVTSVGNGLYVINAPNSAATDVHVKEDRPPDSERTGWLPGLSSPTTAPVQNDNPPAGAPDPVNDAGAPAETKPAEKPERPPVTSGMGEEVDKILAESSTLQKHLQELQAKGLRIEFGKVGVGGVGTSDKPVIYIDPSLKGQPDKIASVIVHEVGHLRNPAVIVSPEGLSMDEHSRRQVESYLDSEGAAVLENLRAHDEGGLEIAGFQPDARYEQVYNDLKANGISEQEAVSRLGQIYGDGELHGDSRVTYRDHYTQAAQQDWEKAQNRQ